MYALKINVDLLPRKLVEARQFKVGVGRSGVVYDYLKEQGFANLREFNVVSRFLLMLNRGRIDLVAYNEFSFGFIAGQQGFNRSDYVAMFKLDTISTRSYIALSKQTNPKLAFRLKKAYQNIRNSGKYDEIMDRLKLHVNPMQSVRGSHSIE